LEIIKERWEWLLKEDQEKNPVKFVCQAMCGNDWHIAHLKRSFFLAVKVYTEITPVIM
jgi:hypothetical protein